MQLIPENKTFIDAMTYEQLLSKWRFAPAGDLWFQGETGKYWGERMDKLRDADPAGSVAASKSVG